MKIESSRHPLPSVVCSLAIFLGLLGLCCALAQEDPYQRAQKGELLVEVPFEGDYLDLERLQERLEVTVVRLDGARLYLLVDRYQLPALRKEGFRPTVVDPDEFFTQLVRVEPATEEVLARVRRLGGRLVQREEDYAVFRVNRRQRSLLDEQQIEVREIEEGELRPRFVEIGASSEEETAQVIAAGIDVFEARAGIILGRAFDEQIEILRAQGLKVEIVPPPGQGPD